MWWPAPSLIGSPALRTHRGSIPAPVIAALVTRGQTTLSIHARHELLRRIELRWDLTRSVAVGCTNHTPSPKSGPESRTIVTLDLSGHPPPPKPHRGHHLHHFQTNYAQIYCLSTQKPYYARMSPESATPTQAALRLLAEIRAIAVRSEKLQALVKSLDSPSSTARLRAATAILNFNAAPSRTPGTPRRPQARSGHSHTSNTTADPSHRAATKAPPSPRTPKRAPQRHHHNRILVLPFLARIRQPQPRPLNRLLPRIPPHRPSHPHVVRNPPVPSIRRPGPLPRFRAQTPVPQTQPCTPACTQATVPTHTPTLPTPAKTAAHAISAHFAPLRIRRRHRIAPVYRPPPDPLSPLPSPARRTRPHSGHGAPSGSPLRSYPHDRQSPGRR